MKKLNLKLLKKSYYLFGLIASAIVALVITFSCTKTNVESTVNKQLTVPEPLSFEKQFVVYDESGNNSVTLRISADDEALLTDRRDENYELIINPEIPEETAKDGLTTAIEDSELADFNNSTELKIATVQLAIINVSFKEKANNYALVCHVPPMVDEDEVEMEEGELKSGLCLWFPRPSEGFEYYNENVPGAIKVKVTFNRTGLTCNNIIYFICPYNTTSYVASCELKHPGDEETFGPYNWDGINLLWKRTEIKLPLIHSIIN